MALLDVLCALSREQGFKLGAALLNHGLRPEAQDEREGVRAYCAARGIAFYTKDVDLGAAPYAGLSTETAGRGARYAFFEEICSAHGYRTVALAHHLDDQAETVLMRLARGAGPDGASGIAPERALSPSVRLIRPFLSVRKQVLTAYCKKNGVPYFTDRTNFESVCARNTVRLDVLPALERAYPQTVTALGRYAQLNRETHALLEEMLAPAAAAAFEPLGWGVRFAPELFRDTRGFAARAGLPAVSSGALQNAMLRAGLRAAGAAFDVGAVHVEAVRRLFLGASGTLDLPGAFKAVHSGAFYAIINTECCPADFGTYPIPPGRRLFMFAREKAALEIGLPGPVQAAGKNFNTVWLSCDSMRDTPVLRARRPGDRLYFKSHSKKLSRFFMEKGVPAYLRNALPVLACGNDILWVPGYYVNENCRARPGEDGVQWRLTRF